MPEKKARRRPARRTRSKPAAPRRAEVLQLLTPERVIEVRLDEEQSRRLQASAMEWLYVVRNRRRWTNRDALSERQEERARDLLRRLGIDQAGLATIARSEFVQVAVRYEKEEQDWAARILPWEYVLSGATREIRNGPLTVMRQLRRSDSPRQQRYLRPKSILFVESAPGRLAGEYTFDSERELVRSSFPEAAWREERNPTRDQLARAIEQAKPDVVHLAGFDNHQAATLLGSETEGVKAWDDDGYVLADERGGVDLVDPLSLAAILTARGKHAPHFVGCSFWNSASRVAALLVANGVGASVGIQDSFDDGLTEHFFSFLYNHLVRLDGDLRRSFQASWALLKKRRTLRGTGVVLWSEAPLVGIEQRAARARQEKKLERLVADENKILDPAQIPMDRIQDIVTVHVKPHLDLNYSLLHNNEPLLEKFEIVRKVPGRMLDVSVEVDLSVGPVSFPFRRTFELREGGPDLRRDVHTTLTASLARSLRESVGTSLFVQVSWGRHVLHRDTYRVRLLPADQWRDNDTDRIWLPSFVLPRDPAVAGLLERAQRYVRVLRDDPAAGFDGYQSVDDRKDDPTEDVDLQVRAIWSALVYEWQLGYVNPPPTYSTELDSQRLRTPTTIRDERAGTCIDLSLLMAACLELVDIYPVIFLIDGHAFPGYWRSEAYHTEFLEARGGNGAFESKGAGLSLPRSGFVGKRGAPWSIDAVGYAEIVREVDRGRLVPLESVQLTEPTSFSLAIEAGRENLSNPKEFHSMLDIVSARTNCVTPMPIWQEKA